MTQKNKDLLLKDLCARLPYGVKILHEGWNFEWDQELSLLERIVGIDDKFIYTKIIDTHTGEEYRDDKHPIDTFDDKPYLRPMSSMTEEEIDEFTQFDVYSDGEYVMPNYKTIDWLNAHHFDYRTIYDEDKKKYMSMIEKGLAIEVTKENNPYK